MELKNCSSCYEVRMLRESDIELIYELCQGNKIYYQYHPPFVTRENIKADMYALPPNKSMEDKFYIGFFDGEQLVAVMDLIVHFPSEKVAMIGFFMVSVNVQKRGVGSKIIEEMMNALKASGFELCRLAIDQGNPQSEAFWLKNQFVLTGECIPNDFSAYLPLTRQL